MGDTAAAARRSNGSASGRAGDSTGASVAHLVAQVWEDHLRKCPLRCPLVLAVYDLPEPRDKGEAIRRGEELARRERQRLGLGGTPIGEIAELLEREGVRAALVELPDDVSGLTLQGGDLGPFVAVNARHAPVRRRYSFAHEYAHVLVDGRRAGVVSREQERDSLVEVRANAFAAALLLPEQGVRALLSTIGKGPRDRAEVFDEVGVVAASAGPAASKRRLQLHDVVVVAHHFGVSRTAAIYRLANLRLLGAAEKSELLQLERDGRGHALAVSLGLPGPQDVGEAFVHRLLLLGLEAIRRGRITEGKFRELARLAGRTSKQVTALLDSAGVDDHAVDIAMGDDEP